MSLPLAARCAFGHQHDLTKDRTLPFACLHGCTILWYALVLPTYAKVHRPLTIADMPEERSLCLQCGQTGFWD